jgi:dienelactone hydrolase
MFAVLKLAATLAALAPAFAQSPFSAVARKTFADLMVIPLAPPAVEVTVRGVQEEDGLRIEDLAWAAPDGQTVVAFAIRSVSAAGRLPAIVCLHGSSGSREQVTTRQFGIGPWTRPGAAKPTESLNGWGRELARRGYLTLSLTQRGLDTRSPDTNDQAKADLVHGRTLMGAIVEEIRQGITHLAARPDVDPRRIGMTGMSFGGITTFYTWLVDDRIAAAAPICGGVGSVEEFLRRGSRGYHGFYWWIPGMLAKGDQGDFAAAHAPRPLMLWAPLEDIGMPKEGVDRFLEAAQPAYARAGAPGALVVHRPPGGHSFTPAAFEALTAFFDQHLRNAPSPQR